MLVKYCLDSLYLLGFGAFFIYQLFLNTKTQRKTVTLSLCDYEKKLVDITDDGKVLPLKYYTHGTIAPQRIIVPFGERK
jgi:hypothetical protein